MSRQWPELGDRIRERIMARGFKNPAAFADAKGYRITYIYKWLAGTTPDRETLERLAKDLGVTPEWLLFGDIIYSRNQLRKAAARLLLITTILGSALFGGVRAEAQPLPAVIDPPTNASYRKLLRWLFHLWVYTLPGHVPARA